MKVDLPLPFAPSTATRSPYQISVSNGFVVPFTASRSTMTARRPVRAPLSLTLMCCSRGGSAYLS